MFEDAMVLMGGGIVACSGAPFGGDFLSLVKSFIFVALWQRLVGEGAELSGVLWAPEGGRLDDGVSRQVSGVERRAGAGQRKR